MDAPLVIAVNPYHFTGRELPAIAALQLADQVVTILPGAATRAASEEAARGLTQYRRLVGAWTWAEALLREGVIAPAWEGDDPLADVRTVIDDIHRDPRYAPMRALMRTNMHDAAGALESLASDMLRGGPDPALLVPVSTAIDRFAARHGLAAARSAPVSTAQKLEERLGERMCAFSLPMLSQAEPERIGEARTILAAAAAPLRRELAHLARILDGHDCARIEDAAGQYRDGFERARGALLRCVDPLDIKARESTVAITLCALPTDAALRSSTKAAHAVSASPGPTPAPGLVHQGESPRFLSLTIRVIGAQ